MRRWLQRLNKPLVLLAAFALVWAVVRACVQAVVIDEAETFEVFVSRADPSHWAPGSNNHVLNSQLIRLSTLMLGPSHVSLRLPALLGALAYICAAYALAESLSNRKPVQIPAFLCLVYNPLVFDFFTVGRGYSLALAGLLGAFAVSLRAEKSRGTKALIRPIAISSGLLGISFAANFSFAFVDFAALALLAVWAYLAGAERAKALAAAILPMIAVIFFICSWTLLHWPAGQLWDGAKSLGEAFSTVAHDSLFQLNPHILNPLLLSPLQWLQAHLLLPFVGLAAIVQLIVCWRVSGQDRWLWTVAGTGAAVFTIALLAHFSAHLATGLLLPRGRTAIYMVPLLTLSVAAMAAMPSKTQLIAISALWALAASYLLSLRLTYTQEWQYLAEVKDAYWALEYLSREHHVNDVASNWRYGPSLNFYNQRYSRESFHLVWPVGELPEGKEAYVLYGPLDESYARKNHYPIVYRGPESGLIVVVNPAADAAFYGPR